MSTSQRANSVAVQRHGVGRYAEVKMVAGDERVDQIEISGQTAIELDDLAVG